MTDVSEHGSSSAHTGPQANGCGTRLRADAPEADWHQHRMSFLSAATILLTAASLMLQSTPAQSQEVEIVVVDVAAVARGYQASELIGRRVHNDKDETVGAIDDLVILKNKDIIAILQVGGFLGLGGHLVAISFDDLALSDGGERIVLAGGDREELESLPEFEYDQDEEESDSTSN